MKILLFGKQGQVGYELQRALRPLGHIVALDRNGHDSLCGDLADTQGIASTIARVRPDVIVNAAAHTAVDRAESEADLAFAINATAPDVMAQEAAKLGSLLIHYSTDYIFDGSGARPWRETDTPAPLNTYGRSKLAGEQAIQASGCQHLILRTSWVYGKHGHNFVKTVLRLAQERQSLAMVADQIGAPTGARLIADVTAKALATAIHQRQSGIYHLAASGETSWHGYATFIVEQARANGLQLATERIEPVASSAFPTPAQRPANSRLDTGKLQRQFALHLPPWQEGVSQLIKELTGISA
ncbi:MAG: dTDP-4-dehydrorhamnose reductase [Gammaproteobacteria bacterium BRH_c0]|nr:MAG: dTDP-4-dehydrorhamnose reductase [Gammaproteobacteria bacterium BRH_c0]